MVGLQTPNDLHWWRLTNKKSDWFAAYTQLDGWLLKVNILSRYKLYFSYYRNPNFYGPPKFLSNYVCTVTCFLYLTAKHSLQSHIYEKIEAMDILIFSVLQQNYVSCFIRARQVIPCERLVSNNSSFLLVTKSLAPLPCVQHGNQ